ncbi:MAG: low molecular weight protein-tyrosine-phosphatase [Solirubrobacteraceae bacterium]
MHVIFVCLGNICRSPTAEAVMKELVRDAGLEDRITVDSAGTGDWHVGSPADPRTIAAAERRGIRIAGVGRQVTPEDLEHADRILALDASNLANLRAMPASVDARERIRLLRSYDPEAVAIGELDVPDPYTGGPEGFDLVIDQVRAACAGLLDELRAELETEPV